MHVKEDVKSHREDGIVNSKPPQHINSSFSLSAPDELGCRSSRRHKTNTLSHDPALAGQVGNCNPINYNGYRLTDNRNQGEISPESPIGRIT